MSDTPILPHHATPKQAEREGGSRTPILMRLLWAIAIVFTLALFTANLFLGELNQDEGWYLYGARQVSHGAVPYKDFAFTQGPVLLYVYAAAMPVIDKFGVAGGRLVTAIFGLAGAICAAYLASRLVEEKHRKTAAFLAFVLIGINAYQAYFTALVKTYALSGFLLVLGFVLLVRAREKCNVVASFFSGVVLALCAGTRLSAGIAIPIVFICLFLASRSSKKQNSTTPSLPYSHTPVLIPPHTQKLPYSFLAGAVLMSCVVFLPFLLKCFDSFIFSTCRYHAGRDGGGLMGMLMLKAGTLARLVGVYFVAFSLLVMVLFRKLFHTTPAPCHAEASRARRRVPHSHTPVLLSVIAIAVIHFMAPFPYDEYQVMLYPLFAAVLAALVTGKLICTEEKKDNAPVAAVACILVVSLAAVYSSAVVQNWVVRDIDRLWLVKKDMPPLIKLQRTANYITGEFQGGPGVELLTQDPYLAVETGMDLPKGLEMGQFSYFPAMNREDAQRRNVLNAEMFREVLRNSKAPVAAFSGYGLSVRSPQVTELSKEERDELNGIVEERYELKKEVENFGQADTLLKIYVLKDAEE